MRFDPQGLYPHRRCVSHLFVYRRIWVSHRDGPGMAFPAGGAGRRHFSQLLSGQKAQRTGAAEDRQNHHAQPDTDAGHRGHPRRLRGTGRRHIIRAVHQGQAQSGRRGFLVYAHPHRSDRAGRGNAEPTGPAGAEFMRLYEYDRPAGRLVPRAGVPLHAAGRPAGRRPCQKSPAERPHQRRGRCLSFLLL